MDSNSKLGPEVIANDPHGQSPNGKVLCDIVTRHGLIVANGISDKCEGSITRRRVTKDTIEESIIDHVIISEDLVSELDSLKIDEKQEHVLTKYTKTKTGVKKTKSDHNVLFTNFKINWNSKVKSARIEMFNLKNKSCQLMFNDVTSNTDFLSSVFLHDDDINTCTRKFLKRLNQQISKCFKKVRITERQNKDIEELFEKRKVLRNSTDEISEQLLLEVEAKLADLCAEQHYQKIKEEIDSINGEDGGVNPVNLWRLTKKLNPKCRDPPTAMMDPLGNLVTSAKAIESLALKTT